MHDHHEGRALSVGGVVLRRGGHEFETVICRRGQTWFLPKGTPESWEHLEQAALREVREETGLDVRMAGPLGRITYRFAAGGTVIDKVVLFYLMRDTGGDVLRHDGEYEEVRWAPVTEALQLLSFENYREVLSRGSREWDRRAPTGGR